MAKKPTSVNGYISNFSGETKKRLIILREIIRKAAPDAEEIISYNMPLYKLNGMLISFAAWKKHIALYPVPKASGDLKKKLEFYKGAKSTLRFPMDKPLPQSLISKVVRLRVKENASRIKVEK